MAKTGDKVFIILKLLKISFLCKMALSLPRQFATSHFFIITMRTGTVKFFNSTKGYGFIVDSSTNEEIFVHATGLIDEIRQGDSVTFETARGKKGVNAVNVRLA